MIYKTINAQNWLKDHDYPTNGMEKFTRNEFLTEDILKEQLMKPDDLEEPVRMAKYKRIFGELGGKKND